MTGPHDWHFIFRLRGVVVQTDRGTPRMTPGMGDLLQELSPDFNLWLFCEAAEDELSLMIDGLQLAPMVPATRRLSAAGNFRTDMPEELVDALVKRTGGPRESLLWIDDRPSVTSAVIRAGMNAVVFVDIFRLRRNLVLRGLVK